MDEDDLKQFLYYVRRIKLHEEDRGLPHVVKEVRVRLKLEDNGETLAIYTEDRYE